MHIIKPKSTHYITHILNTSDTKAAYTFSKGERFSRITINTPNKFYDYKTCHSRRATSMGFGKKINLINKYTSDPGQYQTKSNFQQLLYKNSTHSTFGQSHDDIYTRVLRQSKTPGPGKYHPSEIKTRSRFYISKKTRMTQLNKSAINLGPTTYTIDTTSLQKLTKFPTTKCFRIKTDIPTQPKLPNPKISPGPTTYDASKLYSLARLAQNKPNGLSSSFSKQLKFKNFITRSNIGPTTYQSFSVFGNDENS